MRDSQLIVLSRAFPETVALMIAGQSHDLVAMFEAYKRDLLVLTGTVYGEMKFNDDHFWDAVSKVNKKRRNSKVLINAVEYELVAGWFYKGYALMTPPQRVAALKKQGLPGMSADNMRKICAKLKLPPMRKPGHH